MAGQHDNDRASRKIIGTALRYKVFNWLVNVGFITNVVLTFLGHPAGLTFDAACEMQGALRLEGNNCALHEDTNCRAGLCFQAAGEVQGRVSKSGALLMYDEERIIFRGEKD